MTTSALTQDDREFFERLLYKANDDIAVSISRSFERLGERIDSVESRLYGHITEIENEIQSA